VDSHFISTGALFFLCSKAVLRKPSVARDGEIGRTRREPLACEPRKRAGVLRALPCLTSFPAASRAAPFAFDPKDEHVEILANQNSDACGGARALRGRIIEQYRPASMSTEKPRPSVAQRAPRQKAGNRAAAWGALRLSNAVVCGPGGRARRPATGRATGPQPAAGQASPAPRRRLLSAPSRRRSPGSACRSCRSGTTTPSNP
jgi:hypothetical protein